MERLKLDALLNQLNKKSSEEEMAVNSVDINNNDEYESKNRDRYDNKSEHICVLLQRARLMKIRLLGDNVHMSKR